MQKNKRGLFVLELTLAIIITVICSLIGMSNLLWEANRMYPAATDAMGHMTKVVYLSEQLLKGHLPSWFPFWYNGEAMVQYYGPLSYYLMVPIYWITNNIMLTFKIFCAATIGIGGLGVWSFCYRKIGRACGLVGIIAFCLQPILLQSAYREGVIEQGLIIAIMPWLLMLILSLVKKPTKGKYVGTILLTTLMILSNAMHSFRICLSIMVVLFLFILIKRIRIRDFFIAVSSIVFSGVLTAFWSLVGVTWLENPGIPYLFPEVFAYKSANLHWFIPGSKAFFYFSIEVSALCITGIICYIISRLVKRHNENHAYYGLACIALTIITFILSFGQRMPGFKYLPFASSMVAGEILTLTAVSAAITGAYAIYTLWKITKLRFLIRPIVLGLIAYLGYALNPFSTTYSTLDPNEYGTMKELAENTAEAFDKGRYQWLEPQNSAETFISYINNYNISNGWNKEGTLHNQVLYNYNIALPIKEYDYILKETAFWNIRYLLLPDEYQELAERLENELGFRRSEDSRNGQSLYISDEPSAYYLTDSRNALVISTGMQGFSVQFPYFVQGKSSDILDYTEEELLKYKLIYIIEPDISTLTRRDKLEDMVTRLTDSGVTVMIEPLANRVFDLFGVRIDDEIINETIHIKATAESPYEFGDISIENNSNLRIVRSLYNLDEVYANYEVGDSDVSIGVLGAKNVGKGKVIFVGAHLSQYLDTVYTRNNGIGAYTDIVKENSNRVKDLYSDIFTFYDLNKDYLPEVYDSVKEHHWDYNGGTFTYESDEAREVTISITYTPRWSASLDGIKIPVGRSENLITLILPEGQHRVELTYGMTIYGKIGYLISAFGMVLLLVVLIFWKRLSRLLNKMADALGNYLQIYDSSVCEQEVDNTINAFEESAITADSIKEEGRELQDLTQSDAMDEASVSQTSTEEDTKEAKADDITEDNETQPEDDVDNISIQYRTVNEDNIKIDIIEIDTPSNDFASDTDACKDIPQKPEDKPKIDNENNSEKDKATRNIEKIAVRKIQKANKLTERPIKRARTGSIKTPSKGKTYNRPNRKPKAGEKRRKQLTLMKPVRRKRYISKPEKKESM